MLSRPRLGFAIAIIAALFFLSQPTSQLAQQPAPQQKQETKQPDSQTPDQEPSVRISTQLVQIDATVTDKKGEHVEDLTENDFELTVDGKKQNITYFRLVKLPEPKRPEPGAANAPKPAMPPPSAPMKTIAPEQVARTIAFVVDDLGLSFESMYFARRAIKKFLDEQMQEGDLVAIIRTGRGLGALQQFTLDKRVLYAAVEKLTWNPYSRDMIPRFGSADDPTRPQEAREAEDRFEDFRESVFSVGTLGALNFVVRGLRELPGRKSAILISDGLRLFGRSRDNNLVLDRVRRLTDLANRSSVVIYSLDAKGLQTLMPTAADNPGGMRGPQFADRLSRMSQQNFDSQEGLVYLARETGGFAVLNNNDINLGVQRALKDQQSYYLLGFDPEDEKFDKKYHSIKLKTRRPGLQTRTRAGFIGYPDRPTPPPTPRTREAQILSSLFSPFGARDVATQMTSFFFNSPNPGRKEKNDPEDISFVRSFFHIGASNLTFKDAGAGEKVLKLEIATFTFNENGAVIEQHGRAFEIRLDQARYARALKRGFNYTDDFVIKKPGAYQFRAVIRDAETGRMGSAGQFIQVPDLSKNRLELSGLVLTSFASESDNQSTNPPTNPPTNPSTGASTGAEDRDDIQPTPGVRRFSSDSVIDYGAFVYNHTLDPKTGKPQLTIQLEIYRDGKVLHQMEPRSIDPGAAADPKRLDCGGRLKLTSFPPGDYMMRIVVTDQLTKQKYARAEQWMDFSVR